MAKRPRSWTISIFLLKEATTTAKRTFKAAADLSAYPIKIGKQKLGDLYVEPSDINPASWAAFFKNKLPNNVKLLTASSAAVLVVKVGGRHFAVTFGQGRHLLRPGCWEENFGLRVTLNSIDAEQILSMDRKSLESLGRQAREQTGRAADITAFGINIEQDLLRAITGTPSKEALGKRMTGADALTVVAHANIESLPTLLTSYTTQYTSEAYKERFGWVDHIAQVKDANIEEKLDEQLIDRLRDQPETVWMAPPDLLDWSDVRGFRYRDTQDAQVYTTIELEEYLAEKIDNPKTLSVDRLKSHRVGSISLATDTVKEAWTAYRCLNAEVLLNGSTYILSNGKWYRIDTDFVAHVNAYMDTIPACELTLPNYVDATEAAYSSRIADADPAFVLFDRKTVQYGGGKSKIEICDLYHNSRRFIHIKPYSGSGTLSHLYNQGVGFRHIGSD